MLRYTHLSDTLKRDMVAACVAELSFMRFGSRAPFYLIDGQLRREVIAVLEAADNFSAHRGLVSSG